MGGKQTESAVYGYMQRPEIIEFRGQYFYGPNSRPGDPLDASGSNMAGVSHSHGHSHGHSHSHAPPWEGGMASEPSHSYQPFGGGGGKIKTSGIEYFSKILY